MADAVRDQLVRAAVDVRRLAYAKYSGFLVGAAVLGADGETYSGCNVENGSYGLTICAERAAVFAAVAAGQRELQMLAIATAGGATPCGACRQVLAEFARELPILLVDVEAAGKVEEVKLSELLPRGFRFEQT